MELWKISPWREKKREIERERRETSALNKDKSRQAQRIISSSDHFTLSYRCYTPARTNIRHQTVDETRPLLLFRRCLPTREILPSLHRAHFLIPSNSIQKLYREFPRFRSEPLRPRSLGLKRRERKKEPSSVSRVNLGGQIR